MPGRQEALGRSYLAGRRRSISELQNQFTNNWFPGGDGFEYPIIRVHDAAHQWSNISPSPRGELQQNVLDLAGSLELYERTGARGVVNSIPFSPESPHFGADALNDEAVAEGLTQLQRASKQLEHPIRGVLGQRDLAPNDPARLQLPPLTLSEMRELSKRGKEFYGHVSDVLNAQVPGLAESQDRDAVARREPFSPAPGIDVELPVNPMAAALHSPQSGDLVVEGGYDAPGRMSYGPKEARLNRSLHYTVDQGLLMREAGQAFRRELAKGMARPRVINASPQDRETAEAVMRQSGSQRLDLPEYIVSPEMVTAPAKKWFADHDRLIRDAEAYGMGKEASALEYVVRGRGDELLLDVAARARDLAKVRNAVRTGFNATADLAGSVPLFDPQFRQAVERGDVRKAGEQLVKEYVAGAVAAPVVGAGTGVLQRLAPRAAARVLPALAGAARVGNPVAVASQLGGDRRPSARQTAEERRLDPGAFGAQGPSANPQLLKAEAARRRGGRWKVGPWTLPEFGLTEAGGLFFR